MSESVRRQVRGVPVILELDDTSKEAAGQPRNYELWRADTYATKEPDTLDWLDRWVGADDVLYDVGANIGQYSLYAALRQPAAGAVLAFEPEALTFAKLNRNVVANGAERVIPYCLCVADGTALDRFYVKNFVPGASLHAIGRPVTQGEEAFAPQHIQGTVALSLDDIVALPGVPFPTLIKVDVDGIEERIVGGGARTFADPRLRSCLIEVYIFEQVAERIVAMLEAAGMTLENPDAVHAQGTAQNLIFRR